MLHAEKGGRSGRLKFGDVKMMSHDRDLNFLVISHLLPIRTLQIDYVWFPQLVYKISEEPTPYTQVQFKCHPTIVTNFGGRVNLLCMCRDTIVYFGCTCISPLSSKVVP